MRHDYRGRLQTTTGSGFASAASPYRRIATHETPVGSVLSDEPADGRGRGRGGNLREPGAIDGEPPPSHHSEWAPRQTPASALESAPRTGSCAPFRRIKPRLEKGKRGCQPRGRPERAPARIGQVIAVVLPITPRARCRIGFERAFMEHPRQLVKSVIDIKPNHRVRRLACELLPGCVFATPCE